jgi:hypothetical protein
VDIEYEFCDAAIRHLLVRHGILPEGMEEPAGVLFDKETFYIAIPTSFLHVAVAQSYSSWGWLIYAVSITENTTAITPLVAHKAAVGGDDHLYGIAVAVLLLLAVGAVAVVGLVIAVKRRTDKAGGET